MKRVFTLLAALLFSAFVMAQIPNKMSYQAVIRDGSNKLVSNHAVGIQLSILKDAVPIYVETHTTNTNANGLLTLEIGAGNVVSGKFAGIDWTNGSYSIKTETDPLGGTTYTIIGTSQLLSVPFALMSNIALKSLNDLDTSASNELQKLKLSNDTLYLDRGGYVYLGGNNNTLELQNIRAKSKSDSSYFETKINNEHISNLNNNNSLLQKIVSDSNYLKGLINTNTTAITNETNSRINGEQSIKSKQLSDSAYFKGQIATETTNRMIADNGIRSKMSSDSVSFRSIISSTITNLTNETNSRINSE